MGRRKIRIISAVAAAFLIAVGFAVQGHSLAAQYELLLDNSRTHAYYELSTAVSELDAALQKAQYATTPVMVGVLCTDIYGKALSAQMALGELPASGVTLEQTAAFLARVGDYACSVSKGTAVSGGSSKDAHTTLHSLASASSALASSLLELQADLLDGSTPVDTLIRAEEVLAQMVGDGGSEQGGNAFQSAEADFPEIPTLIYDGPFSEHLSNRTPLALEGLPFADRDSARTAAAAFLGLRPERLTLIGQGLGVLPTWEFSASENGDELYIEVTQQGSRILSLIHSRTVRDANLTVQEARNNAHMFLGTHGYKSMEESYHINQGNVLTVQFAPSEQGVLCYPDLVKVSVALDDGSIVGFESHGWIMNHTKREIPTPAIDADAARAVVSSDLEILSHRLALIPTGGEYEVLCHEFKCRTRDGSHVIVYVNASTGNEEKILLLLENENGTLVR